MAIVARVYCCCGSAGIARGLLGEGICYLEYQGDDWSPNVCIIDIFGSPL